jgi:hypothetical protein
VQPPRDLEPLAWLDGTPVLHSPTSAFVLPGNALQLALPTSIGARRVLPTPSAGDLEATGPDRWAWTAPQRPGLHTLRLIGPEGTEHLLLRVFVLEPASSIRNGRLSGYRVGNYPEMPLGGDTTYIAPKGFVEVSEENRELHVSPRFKLKHFETKQGGEFPRYVVLRRTLLTKLELIVDALADRGYPVTSLHVMSGYRTPAYNEQIGQVQYSRHQWGDASDIFVDEDGDGRMDDLDGDGRITVEDARVLFQVVDSLDRASDSRHLLGGLGLYAPNAWRGPFVHVDTRGHIARW